MKNIKVILIAHLLGAVSYSILGGLWSIVVENDNFYVILITFVYAIFAWPVLAKRRMRNRIRTKPPAQSHIQSSKLGSIHTAIEFPIFFGALIAVAVGCAYKVAALHGHPE